MTLFLQLAKWYKYWEQISLGEHGKLVVLLSAIIRIDDARARE